MTAKSAETPPVPSSIRVGHLVYTVHVGGPEWRAAQLEASTPDGWGLTAHRNLTISIADDQAPGQIRDTLLHEVMHAIAFAGGQVLDMVKPDDGEMQEPIIRVFCGPLLACLRDNPDLVRFLTADA